VQCTVFCAIVPAVCTSVPCTTSTQLLHFFFVQQLKVSKCTFCTLAFSMPLTASKNSFLHWPCTQCMMCLCSIITLIQHMLYIHYTGLEIHNYIYSCSLQLLFLFQPGNSSICLTVITGSRILRTIRLKFPPAVSNSLELHTVALYCAVPDWQQWLWSQQHKKWSLALWRHHTAPVKRYNSICAAVTISSSFKSASQNTNPISS
jgi:hypothetical protein